MLVFLCLYVWGEVRDDNYGLRGDGKNKWEEGESFEFIFLGQAALQRNFFSRYQAVRS